MLDVGVGSSTTERAWLDFSPWKFAWCGMDAGAEPTLKWKNVGEREGLRFRPSKEEVGHPTVPVHRQYSASVAKKSNKSGHI